MKKLPIKAAKDFAHLWNQDQVIIMTWNKTTGITHVVTYGKTVEDCKQAALGGNLIKKAIGFPAELCNSKPRRQLIQDKCEHTWVSSLTPKEIERMQKEYRDGAEDWHTPEELAELDKNPQQWHYGHKVCSKCKNKDFSYFCPKSTNGDCVYGKDWDCCDYCGLPKERK